MQIKAVLFDIDGTLVDSNDQHVLAWEESFATIGARFDRKIIHDQIGKGTDMLVPTLLPGADPAEPEKLGKVHGEIFARKFLDQVEAFPGARELLATVQADSKQVVLASSAAKSELDHYLGLLDIREIVSATTTADDVENTKPAPDIFATALARVAPLTAMEVLVVGDSPYDMEAARKCGIAAIAVRSGKFSDASLLRAGAATLYDDVAALLADYRSSPLAR